MKVSPWILGAAALVPAAGAYAGSNIGTDPIGLHADVTESIPAQASAYEAAAQKLDQDRLPDHYAMETPEGRVEIADLALRGRYRDRGYDRQVAHFDDYDLDAELTRMEKRWDVDASTSRAAAALDAQQPRIERVRTTPRYAEAPHYTAMQQARVGQNASEIADGVIEVADTAQPETPTRVAALETRSVPKPRAIDVQAELALQR